RLHHPRKHPPPQELQNRFLGLRHHLRHHHPRSRPHPSRLRRTPDPMVNPDEPRFWSHVVKGDDPSDCWIWTGAISDDGYGRYWTTAGGRQKVLRPHRYAYQLITGHEPQGHILHECDFPLCVHADSWTTAGGRQKVLRAHRYAYQLITGHDPQRHILHACVFPLSVHAHIDDALPPLTDGTNAENVAARARRKRSGNQHTSTSIVGAPRRARYELMTEIRDWVKANGYDRERIAALIAGYDPDAPTLF